MHAWVWVLGHDRILGWVGFWSGYLGVSESANDVLLHSLFARVRQCGMWAYSLGPLALEFSAFSVMESRGDEAATFAKRVHETGRT
jgi:hypothetical protein